MTSLIFDGDLELMGATAELSLVALSTNEGTSWGNPEAVDVTLRSFLQHGELVETETWNNRTLDLVVSARGESADDLAAVEMALVRRLHRASTLAFTPETATVATVFPVLTSTLVPTHDDFAETYRLEVIYQIRMTCPPFVRGAVLRTIAALAAGGSTTTTIEDVTTGSTGWSGAISVVTDESVVVNTSGVTISSVTDVYPSDSEGGLRIDLEKTFTSFSTATTKYIGVDWLLAPGWGNFGISLTSGSTVLPRVADVPSPDYPTMTRSFFAVPSATSSVTNLKVRYSGALAAGSARPGLTVKKLVRSDVVPQVSPKALARTLTIEGVMPTTGSVAISHASGLGDVHFYSYPTEGAVGYLPFCRRFVQAAGTTDTARVSGAWNNLANQPQYKIPIAALPPGDYTVGVIATFSSGVNRNFNILATPYMGGSPAGPDTSTDYNLDNFYDFTAGGYQLMLLDTMTLPNLAMAAASGTYQEIILAVDPLGGTARVDELLLFNNTIGQRTQVACGAKKNLWIDSPDVNNQGQPGLFVGNNADRSDAVSAFALAESIDVHEFDPVKGVSVAVITTTPSTPASVSFSYYDNYWYRVAPVAS